MTSLHNIEVGILLAIILLNPPLSGFLAILTVLLMEMLVRAKGVACTLKKDLKGKVAIITGAGTGIGKETALELARQGCEIIIAARDVKKAVETMEFIRKETGNLNVHYMMVDLSSKKHIEEFVDEVKSKYSQIDYLINNAGIMMVPQRELTVDGFEMQMGTNHLGHFYLTFKLWDLLKKAKDLRIVNVSSMAHNRMVSVASIDWEDFNHQKCYGPMKAYGSSKLANVLFTQELAERLASLNPTARAVCLHPGIVRTELISSFYKGREWMTHMGNLAMYLFSKSPREGAQTTLYTVLEQSHNLTNGAYYDNNKIGVKNPFTFIPENQKNLWKKSEELLGITFDIK